MSEVFFRKDNETSEEVQYSFGPDFSRFTRTLTVSKESQAYTPDDGNSDREFRKATWGISARFAKLGSWPERGQHVSG